jgi:hypothetical protein
MTISLRITVARPPCSCRIILARHRAIVNVQCIAGSRFHGSWRTLRGRTLQIAAGRATSAQPADRRIGGSRQARPLPRGLVKVGVETANQPRRETTLEDSRLHSPESSSVTADVPHPGGMAKVVAETARALPEGACCDNCGRPLKRRQRRACSGRCRAESSRRRRGKKIEQTLAKAQAYLASLGHQLATGQRQ